jgi:crotonobetainyl-CoA:carnitine CoA-transferase CaiB-like acyl-CoA transferase
MSLTGFPGAPVRATVPYVDYGTALHAAFGAMVALYEKQKTGRGQLIDVSLLATGVTFMLPLLAERAMTGIERRPQGNTAYYVAPADTYRTKDGWITVQALGNQMFGRWARLVGREDLLDDPRCKDDITRASNYTIINEIMSQWCAARTRLEAVADLERARIPCGPVYELDETLSDSQVKARYIFQEVEHPGSGKPVLLTNTAVRLSESTTGARHRAPQLGEHTDEVLKELGFTADEIADFREAGAI